MRKILVVEDEADIRESIVDMLELAEYETEEAANGEEALALLAEATTLPDLIISDIMMPQLDGYGLFRAVRGRFETSQIPIVFLTALANYDEMRLGMELGADDYLIKPFNFQQLSKAIDTRLNKQSQEKEHRYRQMTHQLIELREKENLLLAGRLKELSQTVIGLKLLLDLTPMQSLQSTPDVGQIVTELKQSLDESTQLLSPIMMCDELNLVPLLAWLIKHYTEKGLFEVDFQRAGYSPIFDNQAKLSIFRIFEEALNNILQHSECTQASIRIRTSLDRFYATLEDDGIGFNLHDLASNVGGGLTQAIERAHMLGGELDIITVPNQGVKITLSIPLPNSTESIEIVETDLLGESEAKKVRNETAQANTVRVIVAERRSIVRYGVCSLLAQGLPNANVVDVTNAKQLLEQLDYSPNQIVLLDLMLEDSGGFELIKVINFRFPNIHLIAFSDRDQEMYAAEALRCGAGGYLLKSATTLEIIEAITTVLDKKQFISAEIREAVEIHLSGQEWHGYSPLDSLTNREKEIMFMVLDGLNSSDISERLVISKRTVEKHRSNFMNKLGLKTPTALIQYASKVGLKKSDSYV